MTLVTYTNDRPATTTPRPSLHRLAGTRHEGPAWTSAVRVLRAAVTNAVGHAGARRSVTSNSVGVDIIDNIARLDAKSLHILALVFAMLVRASRRDQ